LNNPIFHADLTYASILFDWDINIFIADVYGGRRAAYPSWPAIAK